MVPALPRADALRVFAVAWAIATLFDFGSIHRWDRTVYDFVLVAAAFATIIRGGTLRPLLLLAAFQLFTTVTRSPWVSNHWLLMGFVNVGLLSAWLILALRARRVQVDPAELYALFAPAGRLCLVLLYFYVVFHKLNPDFLDPDASSGALFWTAHAEVLPLLPVDARGVRIGLFATLIAEAAIPLLLIFRATRWVGLVVGLVFHGLVGLSPLGRFWDFSSAMFALYVLFLPETTWNYWWSRWPRIRQAPVWRLITHRPFAVRLTAGVLLVAGLLGFLVSTRGESLNSAPFRFFWMLYAPAFTLFVLAPGWLDRTAPLAGGWKPRHPLLLLAPGLVFLNGLNPYLGLKTESSFAMFSNLQTENGRSNHYLVPATLQIFPFQRQSVEIIDTTNPELLKIQAEGRLLTLFELRLIAHESPGGSARVRYDGEEFWFEAFRANDGILKRPHPLWRRYLRFRPFYVDGRSGNWH
jgi:hypothetical protein